MNLSDFDFLGHNCITTNAVPKIPMGPGPAINVTPVSPDTSKRDEAIAKLIEQLKKISSKMEEVQIDKLKFVSEQYEPWANKCYEAQRKKEEIDTVIAKFPIRKEKELNDLKQEIGLDEAVSNYKQVEKEIEAAIEKTNVLEENVAKTLTLAHESLTSTFKNHSQTTKLSTALDLFGDLFQRAGSSKLTVEEYFNANDMSRFVSILIDNEIRIMDDLICKDDESCQNILKIIENGMNKEHNEWEASPKNLGQEEPKTSLSLKQKKFFKNVCLKPETWESEQKEKAQIVKDALISIGPLLSNFLDQMEKAIKQSQLEFAFGSKEDEKDNIDINNINVHASKEELRKEFEPEAEKVTKEDAALEVVGKQTIQIIDSMIEKYQDPNICKIHRPRALELAHGIEEICREIAICIESVSDSLRLANEILELQPETMTEKSESFWNAVDRGLAQIFKDANTMSKMGEEYYLFFIKFKESLKNYLSSNNNNNELDNATECLRKDIKEFEILTTNFANQVKKLGETAMSCIEDSICTAAGAENFKQNKSDCDKKRNIYLGKKEIYDKKEYELNREFELSKDKQYMLKAELSAYEEMLRHSKDEMSMFDEVYERLQQEMDDTRSEIDRLRR